MLRIQSQNELRTSRHRIDWQIIGLRVKQILIAFCLIVGGIIIGNQISNNNSINDITEGRQLLDTTQSAQSGYSEAKRRKKRKKQKSQGKEQQVIQNWPTNLYNDQDYDQSVYWWDQRDCHDNPKYLDYKLNGVHWIGRKLWIKGKIEFYHSFLVAEFENSADNKTISVSFDAKPSQPIKALKQDYVGLHCVQKEGKYMDILPLLYKGADENDTDFGGKGYNDFDNWDNRVLVHIKHVYFNDYQQFIPKQKTYSDLGHIINEMSGLQFRYHVANNNCHHFAQQLMYKLTGIKDTAIPDWKKLKAGRNALGNVFIGNPSKLMNRRVSWHIHPNNKAQGYDDKKYYFDLIKYIVDGSDIEGNIAPRYFTTIPVDNIKHITNMTKDVINKLQGPSCVINKIPIEVSKELESYYSIDKIRGSCTNTMHHNGFYYQKDVAEVCCFGGYTEYHMGYGYVCNCHKNGCKHCEDVTEYKHLIFV